MIRHLPWIAALVVGAATLAACASEPEQPPPNYPPNNYQQPPPNYQQPPPNYQQPPPTTAAPPPATAAPPATGTTGTPTAIPGVEKRPDGTCWITPPAMGGQPPTPVMLPACPPGT
ncbi:MAG: hypothetical protein JRI68_07940 [Deltaproteobacteria bacterium]|nr:hypothetical protein [Deltaproteobacteria bacterium]